MDAEKTIVVVGATMREMGTVLKNRAYRERDPIMLTEPFHEGGCIECIFKYMRDRDGKRLPDELNTGSLRVIPDVDGVRGTFRAGDFPDRAMFWRTFGDIVKELGERGFVVRGEDEQAAPTEPTPTAPPAMQAQATDATPAQAQSPEVVPDRDIQYPTPKSVSKVKQLTTDQKIGLAMLIVAVLGLIVAILSAPFIQ
jgi:acetylornithine deacetylase/succinyl-diaminopimelate desuccinylase-like protein